jgi:hypothetical protein
MDLFSPTVRSSQWFLLTVAAAAEAAAASWEKALSTGVFHPQNAPSHIPYPL